MKNITITTLFNLAEAQLMAAQLEAAGFHPFLPDEIRSTGFTLGQGGIRIQVPEDEAAAAQEFLATPGE